MDNKYGALAFVAGLVIMCLLAYFGIFNCAGCGEEDLVWDGDCYSELAEEIQDDCCMDVDMCAGYTTQNPSECYHRYCTQSEKYCEAGDYDIATETYTCKCVSWYA